MGFNNLQSRLQNQLERRGFMPTDESECMLRLMEEVGELAEALREGHTEQATSREMVDVCWQVMRLAILKGIDLDAAFEDKYQHNETRD